MGKGKMIFIVLLVISGWCLAESPALAQRFPTKDMTIVCGSKPGAPIDVFARQMASKLEKALGKPVVVQNKTGGTQAESLSTVLSKPADGHTMQSQEHSPMPKVAPIDQRKADHIKINLEQDVRSALTTGLERVQFTHEALPELDLNRVDASLSLFGKPLAAPILISSMTGGTSEAETIKLRLAEAARETGIVMGVGSQRAAIEHP